MKTNTAPRVGVIYHGDAERRRTATPATSKVPSIFPALAAAGMEGVPVVYHDDLHNEVRTQLLGLDAALVWVNPIENGQDRRLLDALLRDFSATGRFVCTHPDIILKLGTKQVLIDTRSMSWSAPGTVVYRTPAELRTALAAHLATGATRVLKQYRGHSGHGIWKVEAAGESLRVREAPRGSPEELLSIDAFVECCTGYFSGEGRMVDQPWQVRLPEGMIRCYLVHDKVEGFGHQAVNALCSAPPGAPRDAFPAITTRLYYPPDKPWFQALKVQLEGEWLPQLQALFGLAREQLPVLWDCDFMLGPKDDSGADTYVLCEINVSSVSPFPTSVLEPMARAVRARVDAAAASPSITAATLAAQLGQPGAPLILDVRKVPAFEAAPQMLPGAERVAPDTLKAALAQLARGREVVVYCVHGHQVSQGAARTLIEAGFAAKFLDGGIECWREAGLPLQPHTNT